VAERGRLRVGESLTDLLRSLHPGLRRKIRAGVNAIREDPLAGKELRDDLAGMRSFQVGRFRIIYRVTPRRVIELVAIGPRRTIYENTFRLLRRERGTPQ